MVANRHRYAQRLHRQGRVALSLPTTEWHVRVCDSSYAFASRTAADITRRHIAEWIAIFGEDLTFSWTPYRESTTPGLYAVQIIIWRKNPVRRGGFTFSAGRFLKSSVTRKRVRWSIA